jgi:3-alpha domain
MRRCKIGEDQHTLLVIAGCHELLRVVEEGKVQAGDKIVRVAIGPEHMTVFEINALCLVTLAAQLERALRIPALSEGWRASFQGLIEQRDRATGSAGLTGTSGPPPAWSGFSARRVSRKICESSNVILPASRGTSY